jgi:hypothetical protein
VSQNQIFALIGSVLVLGAVLAMWLRGSRPQGMQVIGGGIAFALVLVLIAVVLDKA